MQSPYRIVFEGVLSSQPKMTPSAPATATVYERGPNLLVRFIWWLFIGWWASAFWIRIARPIQLTVIGIPVALLMFNRTPFVASLYRY